MKRSQQLVVRKLTLRSSRCHDFDASRQIKLCRYVTATTLLLLAHGLSATTTQAWQPTEDITQTAESYLLQKTGNTRQDTTVQAGALDPRHRLPLCDVALEGFMRRGAKIASRTIVGVRCTGSKPWKVYLPVDVIVMADVLTARFTLPRGHLVTGDDLVTDKRDVSRMFSGYLTDPSQLIGQRVKQQLIAGLVITPAMLQADQIVHRGQTVTLTTGSGGVMTSMTGTALMNGALNQRIRVENINSGRIIEGVVRSSQHVEVLAPAITTFIHANPKVSAVPVDTRDSNNDR